MTWTPINFEPGVYKDDSPLKAQGYYIDANEIRFVNGFQRRSLVGDEGAFPAC